MLSKKKFPSLKGWHETKKALHAYAKVAGAPARKLAEPHPKWWHVSLKVSQDGLISDNLSLTEAGGNELRTLLNLRTQTLELLLEGKLEESFDLTKGASATSLGAELESALNKMGVGVKLPEEKYADDEPQSYDPEMARRYLDVINNVDQVMKTLREEIGGDRGPVQLWPHHFDLAFEWFGTKTMTFDENGEKTEHPAQLNFGFAPGDSSYPDPYFYSNPWPFDEKLANEPLPHGARWFTDGFEGTMLPYSSLSGADHAADKLLAYFRKVFEVAKPTLMD